MRSTAITTLLVGVFLCGSGCRTNQNLVLLERELRDLEDALFQAQYDLEVCRETSRASCESQAAGSRDGRSEGPILGGEADGPPLDIERLQPPSVELGSPAEALDQLPEKFQLPGKSAPADLPEAPPFEAPPVILPERSLTPPGNSPGGSMEMQGEQSASLLKGPKRLPLVDNTLVSGVAIDTKYSGGFDADGNLGADGIVAAIQARGKDGRLLRAAAPVTVVVLDPALPGDSARVARWDFTVDEVARAYNRSSPGEGLQLKMLWPDEPPVNNRLHLFVRYTTGDGRRCESDKIIQVDLPGRPAQGWSATRPSDSDSQAASRADTERRRQQSRIERPAPVELSPDPLPAARQPVRTASRPARPPRQPPVWSPNR